MSECATCGLYAYDYEYGAIGDGWETATIEQVDLDRVVAVLLGSPPSDAVIQALAELGVVDGEAAISEQLVADLDNPAASFNAVRELVTAFLGTSPDEAPETTSRRAVQGRPRAPAGDAHRALAVRCSRGARVSSLFEMERTQ